MADAYQCPYCRDLTVLDVAPYPGEDAVLLASSFEAFLRGLHEGHEPFGGTFPDG